MKPSLDTYRRKRDFSATSEPAGAVGARRKRAAAPSFVVQRHQARRLHYDFRLEIDGVLVSWAVPKGPSLDPAVKRLAVHVEDHPLQYGSFEGDIPPGHYGAGHVDIWDSGTWQPAADSQKGLASGHLKFHMQGERLRGEWLLLRTGQDDRQWLLRKLDDEFAMPGHDAEADAITEEAARADGSPPSRTRGAGGKTSCASPAAPGRKTASSRTAPAGKKESSKRTAAPERQAATQTMATPGRKAAMPADLAPQLATLVDQPPTGSGWSYEVKYDGYRILCRLKGGKAELVSRNDKDWSARMKGLAGAIGKLGLGEGWLDGEVVCFDENGVSSFQRLQQALDGEAQDLTFVAFDIPFWNGRDLRRLPLSKRQAFLDELLADIPEGSPLMPTQKLAVADGTQGAAAWTEACRLSLEGLICKKLDSPYTCGRSRTWLKLKCRPRQEFVIGGYTAPSGARTHFGALLVGLRKGRRLEYAGRVGTGFTAATLASLHARLKALHSSENPFSSLREGSARYGRKPAGKIQWVKPELVAEVNYAGWTDDRLLRQASFAGLREDKPAAQVQGEQVLPAKEAVKQAQAAGRGARGKTAAKTASRGAKKAAPKSAAKPAARTSGKVVVGGVTVSHPDRLVYTAPDISKADLLSYYESVAGLMMPHLENRRIAMLRCPGGTDATCFFQKHLHGEAPKGIALDAEHVVVRDPRGLLELAQWGVVEFHTWGSRLPKADKPDRITLDLDPDPDLPWKAVVDGALLVRALMQAVGLQPFLKTTGGKGLHLVAPIKAVHGWDTVKAFAKAMASYLAREAPGHFTASVSKARRRDVIFVDYLRNGSGATAIAAFSARARKGAPVSMPLAWDALTARKDLRFDAFNIRNALETARSGQDPWADYAAGRKALRLSAQKDLEP